MKSYLHTYRICVCSPMKIQNTRTNPINAPSCSALIEINICIHIYSFASRTRVRPLRVVHTEHLLDQNLLEVLVSRDQGWLNFDPLLEQFKNQELFLKIKNLQSRNTFLISWIKNTSWLIRFFLESFWCNLIEHHENQELGWCLRSRNLFLIS